MNHGMTGGRRDRILVVDDTSANLQLLTNLLTGQGYTVYPASDGELALEFVRTTIPDLILLDIRMPEMDGFEVCRRLKADERTCAVPIIFISILEDERDKVLGFKAGAVDYITKPFQPEEVLARMQTHLRLRELSDQLEQKVAERTEELTLANQQLLQEASERRRAERQAALFHFALDHVCEAAYLIDETGRFQHVNQEACRALGYTLTELLARGVADVDPDFPVSHWPDHWRELKTHGSLTFEGRHQGKSGHIFPVEINANYFEYLGQCFNLALVRDITGRKRAEEVLQRLNERFMLAAAAAGLAVWDWDIMNNELVWDDRMYGLYGIKREDFAGAYEAWLAGVHPDDRARCDAVSEQARLGEREYDTEFRVVWPDGSIHHLKAYGLVIRAGDGTPLRMTGINFDITARKAADDALQRLTGELEQRVRERTAELEEKNAELERTNRLFVGRELRMIELKQRIKELEKTGVGGPSNPGVTQRERADE
jgi:PAS domain S-box-containing protein